MVTRNDNEQKALNSYASEIGVERVFTQKGLGNKIDSLKKKGRAIYDQFQKLTGTESEVLDMAGATRHVGEFRHFPPCIRKLPILGSWPQ